MGAKGILLNFCIDTINVVPVKGIIFYRKDEYSFGFLSSQIDEECAVLINDITISFVSVEGSTTLKIANHVNGYNPYMGWIQRKLQVPPYVEGSLLWIDEPRNLGYIVRILGSNEWLTYYDVETRWVCVGNVEWYPEDLIVEFATNCIAVINCDQYLTALWLKPEIIENGIQEANLVSSFNISRHDI